MLKDLKSILIELICFIVVFGIECTRTEPSLIGHICLAFTSICLGFCIGLYKGCEMYQENGEEGGVQIGSVKIYGKKDEK